MTRTSNDLLLKLREITGEYPANDACVTDAEMRLALAVDQMAGADSETLLYWIEDGAAPLATIFCEVLPGFTMSACAGPHVLEFYVRQLLRYAYPDETVNLDELVDRLVRFNDRSSPAHFTSDPAAFALAALE